MTSIMTDHEKLFAKGMRIARKLTRAEKAMNDATFEIGISQGACQRLYPKYSAAEKMVAQANSPRERSSRSADFAKIKAELAEASAKLHNAMRQKREGIQLCRELGKTLDKIEKAYGAEERALKKAERAAR